MHLNMMHLNFNCTVSINYYLYYKIIVIITSMYYKELSTRFISQAQVTHSFMNNKHTHSTAIADLAVEMSVKTPTYDCKIHHNLERNTNKCITFP